MSLLWNRTAGEILAIHQQLKDEPVAVLLLYQSHCDWTNSTKPHLEALANEHGFLLVRLNCDHISPEMAGIAIPSVTVFRFGVQYAGPLRRAQTKAVLEQFLVSAGVIDGESIPEPKQGENS